MTDFHQKLDQVERLAKASKFSRLLSDPLSYLMGIGFKNLIYRFTKKGWIRETTTFFDQNMWIELPAGMDIFLVKGKSHDSEIRLSRYLLNQLKSGDTFIDVGAHFGYFSLLASTLVGAKGRVISFEPATRNYELLQRNTESSLNIEAINKAIAEKKQNLIFVEFPPLYSEYNTVFPAQFENEEWYQNNKAKRTKIEALSLTEFFISRKCKPKLIKIDVEGAEHLVIRGLANYLDQDSPIIAMEFLSETRKNEGHLKAFQLLKERDYQAYAIQVNGSLNPINDILIHLLEKKLSSDNIIFQKK